MNHLALGSGLALCLWIPLDPSALPGPRDDPAAESIQGVDPATEERAKILLDGVTKRLRDVRVMRASYVQTRSSPLLIEPLVSKGTLYQRTSPACLVFSVQTPHTATIRVDEDSYQVYRPDEGTAERFVFEGSHAGRALLEAFRPEAEALLGAFRLVDFIEGAKFARLTLRPRDKAARKRVDNVVLSIDRKRSLPTEISYVDREGYEVNLSLSSIDLDPKIDDPERLFSAQLPEGVRLLVHRVDEDPER